MNANEKITYRNEVGNIVIINYKKPFFLLEKTGFAQVGNKISTSQMYGFDGEFPFNSALEAKAITIKMAVIGKSAEDTHMLRRHLIKTFNPKMKGKIIHEIYGKKYEMDVDVVNSWSDAFDEKTRSVQGSVQFKAPTPFWKDTTMGKNAQTLGKTTGLFTFPLKFAEPYIFEKVEPATPIELINDGHVPVGFILRVKINASVKNPRLINIYTREQFAFNAIFKGGDTLFIDTNKNSKCVRLNGKNAYGLRKLGSKFLQLDHLRKNYIALEADSGVENMFATIEFNPLLIGV